jgi:hypothetical protein
MSLLMAQAKLKTDSVAEVQTAAQKLFGAIETAQPEGVRYAWILFPDRETFAALVQVDDGIENPIPGLPEFKELQEQVESSIVEAADVQPLTVIGSYRLF